jgi:hypothetical protein
MAVSTASPAGKSHLGAAIGLALVENGRRVLFTRTTDLVQRLQVPRRELALEGALAKLDKYHLLILDDLAYVSKDQAETSVLFELIGMRYERRSLLITANQPFGKWGQIFPDQAMTLAAIDRLVHHVEARFGPLSPSPPANRIGGVQSRLRSRLLQVVAKLRALLVDRGDHRAANSPSPTSAASDNCRLASMVSGTASVTPIA